MSSLNTPSVVFIAGALLASGVALVASSEEKLAFTDVAAQAGIHAVMRCGGAEKRWIPEANGSGAAWLDYDNDGLPDLLIVNGGTMPQLREILAGKRPEAARGSVYLFHNLGNGRFEDVTEKAGLSDPYWGTGANAADFDNDGFTDILITNIGVDLLYRNNGNGTFTEVGRQAGLPQNSEWHTGSAFGDFDNDGKLDLFITGYIDLHAMSFAEPAPVCDYFGQHTFCGPIGLPGTRPRLYRNNGNGTFTDVTQSSGIAAAPPAHGVTAVTGDFNGDGKLDIFVANDSDPNLLFLNNGNFKFKEAALDSGLAYNADGRVQSNMGIAAGEFGRSGRLDVLTTTFNKDYFPLFRQNKSGTFEEIAAAAGIATVTSKFLGWACGLTDFSNSANHDFWSANGHVYPTDKDYLEPITIFRSMGHRASLIYAFPGAPNNSYRGGATADFDNDGKIDLVILPISGNPVLLRNETLNRNAWLGVTLRGTRSNWDAIGAKVTLEACGQKQFEEERNGGSYISHNDSRIHFGLGSCSKIDRLSVQWPSGTLQVLDSAPLNRYIVVEEPRNP
jgi:enediyne biosynthesis protein E4